MQLNPHLIFNGQCEAAFKFYEKCLTGRGSGKAGKQEEKFGGARARIASGPNRYSAHRIPQGDILPSSANRAPEIQPR